MEFVIVDFIELPGERLEALIVVEGNDTGPAAACRAGAIRLRRQGPLGGARLRLIAWIFVAVGVPVLALDFMVSIRLHHWTLNALDLAWSHLEPSSFRAAQGLIGDRVFEFWSALALLAVGGVLLMLFRRRAASKD